ncbi:autotransporter outer membrane beta-barrel domain-containing protein [Rhizobium cauense]|uniref:autotransporter outer membrane beta-barrel domain-containing protein n=1 Tax=Rhizobium cauense TaxID=1166683 RepID=UPI001C6E54AF|nr:autotransporter outer membrane beta-barrel domain-containing protein [Rhizobium cauense]
MPSYSEKASGSGTFSADYDSHTETALRTELGARFERSLPTESGNVRLTGRVAWAWNAETARTVTASFQNLATSSFTVDGANPGQNALPVDAGADFAVRPNLSVNVSANAAFSNDDLAYGASAKLMFRW